MPLAFMKYWKPAAAIALLALSFGAGWQTNGWRMGEKIENAKAEQLAAFEKRRSELLAAHAEQQERDQAARVALSRDLEAARSDAARLAAEVETLRLTPSSPVIERVLVPGDCESGQPEVVLANPFSDDFVRLWNESALAARSPTPE